MAMIQRQKKQLGLVAEELLGWIFTALMAFALGWFGGRGVLHTAFQLEKSNAVIAAEKAVREKLEEQKRLGDMLSDQLASAESEILKLKGEKQNALLKTTVGNACLNAGTVRVLNGGAKARDAAVPDTPRTSDAGSRGLAALKAAESESALTDRDVAFWIANAQSQYSVCQSRLKALIAFERMR